MIVIVKMQKRFNTNYPIPSPICGGFPETILVGDRKHGFIVRCPCCKYTAARFDELRLTKRGAVKLWNEKIKQLQEEYQKNGIVTIIKRTKI